MPSPKKIFVDDVTIVAAEMLNSIYGGNDAYATADPPSPFWKGHLHNDGGEIGNAPKINLTDHITGRLTIPQPELKSIRLTATQAAPLTSSLFWTVPVPLDAYATVPKSMYLNMYWSANGALSPGNVAFRIDWIYIQAGQNVMPPSIISRGATAWPANTVGANNPTAFTMRYKVGSGVSASQLYVNDTFTGSNLIELTLPTDVPGAALNQFLLLGLEISSAPTITLTQPMSQVNIYAIDLLYYSQTLGYNSPTPTLLSNDPGLADF